MPAQDRVGTHEQPKVAQAGSGQLVQQRRQPGPVGRFEPDSLPVELALQDRDLVS